MSKKAVELFYDVVSPYTWFAFEVIGFLFSILFGRCYFHQPEVMTRYQNRWNISLKLRPFFLGGIMQGSGNKPPAMVPNKGMYLHKDVTRLAKYFDVPLKFPKNPSEVMFVKGTLTAQRFLTAVDMTHPDKLEQVSRELWMRAWSRDEDISEPKSIAEAAKLAGLSESEIASLLSKIKDEAVKERLKKTTQEALDFGAFGSPIILTTINGEKEWVFGSDRFPIFADLIGEKWEGPQPGVSSKL